MPRTYNTIQSRLTITHIFSRSDMIFCQHIIIVERNNHVHCCKEKYSNKNSSQYIIRMKLHLKEFHANHKSPILTFVQELPALWDKHEDRALRGSLRRRAGLRGRHLPSFQGGAGGRLLTCAASAGTPRCGADLASALVQYRARCRYTGSSRMRSVHAGTYTRILAPRSYRTAVHHA